jgi:hypothetical protein
MMDKWATTWGMKFNVNKTCLMKIGFDQSVPSEYVLRGQPLHFTPYVKYLGVIIHNTLKWDCHIDKITVKANRSLFMINRALYYGNPKTKFLAYNACVRFILEYASPVWSPTKQSLIRKLEAIERRAIHFIYRVPKF